MILYLIKFIFCSGLLFVSYLLLLEAEKINHFKRIYLIMSILFSFVIPILPTSQSLSEFSIVSGTVSETMVAFTEQTAIIVAPPQSFNESLALKDFLLLGYLTISSIFLIRFIKNINRLVSQIRRNSAVNFFSGTLILVEDTKLPYSFLKYVFVNKKRFEENSIEKEILAHEAAHISQKHTLDILFIEFVIVFFWFNPFLFMYRKAIGLNHEFLADEKVVSSFDKKAYLRFLFTQIKSCKQFQFSSSFNYLLTKKRLRMMTTKQSLNRSVLKLLALIPIIGFTFYSCGNENFLSEKKLNLVAPNGEQISKDVNELNTWTASVVTEKFGSNKPFIITAVSYYNVKNGYVALIQYKVDNLHDNSYVIVKNPSNPNSRGQQADCIRWSASCSGDTCCMPKFDTNSMNYTCSCSGGGTGCTINFKCIEQA